MAADYVHDVKIVRILLVGDCKSTIIVTEPRTHLVVWQHLSILEIDTLYRFTLYYNIFS